LDQLESEINATDAKLYVITDKERSMIEAQSEIRPSRVVGFVTLEV